MKRTMTTLMLLAAITFAASPAVADETAPPVEESSATEPQVEVEPAVEEAEPIEEVKEVETPEPAAPVQQAPEKETKKPEAKPETKPDEPKEGVCDDLGSGKIDWNGSDVEHTITADPGFLIDAYCIKAGSIKQGNGPEYVDVDPPAESVTISHSSGKGISHFSYHQIPKPHDECPEIEGNQPEGTDCDPPVDVCPDLPGNQPEGTDCDPVIPHDECPEIPGDQPEGTDCDPIDYCPSIPGNQSDDEECPVIVPPKPEPIRTPTEHSTYECGDDTKTVYPGMIVVDWFYDEESNVWVEDEPLVFNWEPYQVEVPVVECPTTDTPDEDRALPNTGGAQLLAAFAGLMLLLGGAGFVFAGRKRG